MEDKTNAIGGRWLCEVFGLVLVNTLAVHSHIAARRQTTTSGGNRIEAYQETMRPEADLRGHLTFHLKHEVASLELLARLFKLTKQQEIIDWISREPTSQYARRVGFLYEWLTGQTLAIDTLKIGGNYVDVLNPLTVVVAVKSQTSTNIRWRVRDNLPGTREFCPTVRLTTRSIAAIQVDCGQLLTELQVEFGEEMLLKSAVWLTLRESKSSFQIEGEVDKKQRIARFADVLHQRTGTGEPPLDQSALALLQGAILGDSTSLRKLGIRRSPVFVGQTVRYQEVIHYVAPPYQDVPDMLEGLKAFLRLTAGASAVMRAAVGAFGFVYIHPLADGNGRVHRFLINDILRRDGAVPSPLIIPVSGLIVHDESERKAYDQALDAFSQPLMRRYGDHARMEGAATEYPDGIRSDFIFSMSEEASPAWRYIDFTSHVEYLADAISRAIRHEMREEAAYLRSHGQARQAIKNIIEMPDLQIDRVIRSIETNQGRLTGALAKEFPEFSNPEIWDELVKVCQLAFTAT